MESKNNLEKNDRESKINFLKQEIANKNYNQLDFINFCLSKKNNGDNIDNWTLEELSPLVQDFKKIAEIQDEKFNINNLDNDNEINTQDKEEDDNINIDNMIEEIRIQNLINGEKDNNIINKDSKETDIRGHKSKNKKGKKEKIIKCKTLEKTVLNEKIITIKVKDSKEINGGLFSKNYISYTIETKPIGWTVQRRYSDFYLLRQLLIKHYPFHKVAPLPNKKIGSKEFSKDYISKRMNYLNIFINSIIQRESFKASEIISSFLSIEDRNKFEQKYKEFNSQIIGNENVEDYKTLDGKLIILYDEKNENYFNNIHKYLKLQNEILIKLNQNLKLFYKNMSSATDSMNEIINNLGILYNINSNVSMKEAISNSFEGLQNLFKGWRKIIINQNNIVKIRIKNFFKNINLSNNAYKDIIEKREELNNKFKTENSKLRIKKEKLYIYRDINKYEIDKNVHVDNQRLLKDKKYAFNMMCTNETKNILKIYKILGYGNKMSMIELKETIKENLNKFVENFKQFKEELLPTVNELSEICKKYELFLNNINNKSKRDYKHKNSLHKSNSTKIENISNIINNEEI